MGHSRRLCRACGAADPSRRPRLALPKTFGRGMRLGIRAAGSARVIARVRRFWGEPGAHGVIKIRTLSAA